MKTGTISSTELGTSCWLSYKVNHCVGCGYYETCTLPDRFRDPEYDRLLEEVKSLKRALVRAQLKKAAFAAGHVDTVSNTEGEQ